MTETTTGTYILELPLKVDVRTEHLLLGRFDAARQVYNAVLGESKRRLRLMRESKMYRKALKMEKGKGRNKAFQEARVRAGFREYDLYGWSKELRKGWIGDHLDSQCTQTITKRAFAVVERHAYGKGGKARFKRKGELRSVEAKHKDNPLRWRGGKVVWKTGRVKLELAPILRDDPVVQHGLNDPVKYVRLCWRVIRGENRFFVQLVLSGQPAERTPQGEGVVGLDIGPSTIALVGQEKAILTRFCTEIEDKADEVRRLQRKLDRQRRGANPQNYNEDGTIKPRNQRTRWNLTRGYLDTRTRIAEVQRKLAAHRKTLHGQLSNTALSMGSIIKTEKLSYRSFQRLWGKSVRMRAPGMFMEMLRRKAQTRDAEVIEFSTYSTALSQTCQCGARKKKPLSLRQHDCSCGVSAQRDLYSAFLARFVYTDDEGVDTLAARAASMAWDAGGGPALQAAARDFKAATVTPCWEATSAGDGGGQSASPENLMLNRPKVVDVVAHPAADAGNGEGHGEGRSRHQSSRVRGSRGSGGDQQGRGRASLEGLGDLPLFGWLLGLPEVPP